MKLPFFHRLWLTTVLSCIMLFSFAQENDTTNVKEENRKEGWTFGALPIIAFNTDQGVQYGALVNLYNYGDGSSYPEYHQSIFAEWSRTTKGSGINRLYFDSEHLIPNVRLTADISYLTEKAMHFFGYNGYEAVYNASWEDDADDDYISRVFYRHDRKIFRIMATFQGQLHNKFKHIKWLAGFAYYDNRIGSVDIDNLNRGKDEDDKLPEVDGLYDKYVDWGIIKPEEALGNKTTYIKAGLVYDSRDFDAFPTKGIWAEAVYSIAPKFLGDGAFGYSRITLSFRQYFALWSKKLVFAYRLGYQGTVSGEVPFHMQPHIVPTLLTSATNQGLGGGRTLRGIQRNRVVGDGGILANAEVRWQFFRTKVFDQNLYLGTNLFIDAGQIVTNIPFNISQSDMGNDRFEDYFAPGTESLHVGYGIGLKVGLNENFIVSVDYGMATDARDGKSGVYVGLNWLY